MKDKMSIIMFSGEFDKAIAAFTVATTAAASGTDVSIYFAFWGLNILKKNKITLNKSQSILQKMFNIMSTSKLPLSRMNFLGLGPWMMKLLMKKEHMASLEELKSHARQLNVKYIACTTSCGVFGIKQNELENVDEFAGAMGYLSHAKESNINLFI